MTGIPLAALVVFPLELLPSPIMSLPLQGFLRFSSAHPSVAFTLPSDLVAHRYGQLVSVLRLCPPYASLSGPDLPVVNRNWILDMDSAVRCTAAGVAGAVKGNLFSLY